MPEILPIQNYSERLDTKGQDQLKFFVQSFYRLNEAAELSS